MRLSLADWIGVNLSLALIITDCILAQLKGHQQGYKLDGRVGSFYLQCHKIITIT